MRAIRWTLPALAAVALLLAAIPTASSAKSCARTTNIEAIVDDSGSMAITDANRLRVQGLDLLINSLSPGTSLGAVEFGSGFSQPAADTIFQPEPVGPNGAAMKSALNQKIHADNGGTDYNAAFAQSDADNPGAQARIFLTDGGHNVGSYNNGHLVHRVPTYVIGFSPGLASSADRARLKQIATDTNGHYYALKDSSRLQSVINAIGAALTCQAAPRHFNDHLKKGQSKSHKVPVKAHTKKIQIALTWASPLDRFTIYGFKVVRHGRTVASSARVRRLKVKITRSSTFVLAKVTGLTKGQLKFKVKATRIGSPEPKVTLTTQVTQARHK